MTLYSSLNREQKQSIGLLQFGTFLEYFDLMLYVHMAVLFNELFFPQVDHHTASLFAALAICSSLAFRPLGAILFGWIGDHIGRKPTIIITTAIMAISCVIMATVPTYAQIGIASAWIVTICRIFQGISSMGEVVGAEIFLTEMIARPVLFPIIAATEVIVSLGGLAALGIATIVTSYGMNWRLVFWLGAGIAIVSVFARKRLRETPEFLDAKRKWIKKEIQQMNVESDPVKGAVFNAKWKEKVNKKTLVSYFFISCGVPLTFYLTFFHFIPTLKENFGYSSEDVIRHNFYLAFIPIFTGIALTYLCSRIHPLRIHRIRSTIGLLLLILLPLIANAVTSPVQIFLIQSLLLTFALEESPSIPVFYSHFPIYTRFMSATVIFAIARALIYAATSFGMIYLVSYFGIFSIWILALPIAITSLYGLNHFIGLERKNHLYPNLAKTKKS
jgi:MFS transporter, MHS family, proline/betaine transporter